MTPERCARALDDALERNVTVKFLLDALAKAGCPVTRRFFTVEKCDTQVVGGFRPGDGVRFIPRAPVSPRSRLLARLTPR
jgi:mitochondrial inner membrane protease ATP23